MPVLSQAMICTGKNTTKCRLEIVLATPITFIHFNLFNQALTELAHEHANGY